MKPLKQSLLLFKKLAMRTRQLFIGLVICAVGSSGPAAWGAELIRNGSFELPDIATGSAAVPIVPTFWTAPGPLTPLMFDQPTVSWPNAQHAEQFVAIHSSLFSMAEAPLSQTFAVSTPGDHVLTWYDNAAIGVAGTPYDVIINGPSSYTLPVNSVLGSSTWRAQSLAMNLAAGSYQLLFRPRPGAGVTLLDTVSLVEEDTPANNPPVAVITVSPDSDLDEGDPEIILISVNGVDAPTRLDGSASTDPDGDILFHSWSLGVIGEPTVNTRLPLGIHAVSLEVSDGKGGSDTAVVSVKVLTVAEAIGYLKDEVNGSGLSSYWKNWLRSSLNVAENLFASTPRPGRPSPCQLGKGGLELFRWLVGALATPGPGSRPAVIASDLAAELIRLTDEILNNVTCE